MDPSAVISAVKWIGTWLTEEGKYLYGVEDHVHRLQDELECMVGLLQEQDQLDLSQLEDRQLAIFTKKIRQIAFQAEDVIDTFIFKVAYRTQGRALVTKCACFLSNGPLIHQTGNQIEDIINEAKEASNRLNRYRVVPKATMNEATSFQGSKSIMLDTYAHTEDEIVIGFDDHIQNLVEQLTHENKLWVIGIVGTGGAGKSTLARKVFHHPDITSYFKHKAWVSISQQWRRRDILYEILRSTRGVRNESEKNWTDRELIEKLYAFLKDECYLIVLDDIWNTNAWDQIRVAIPHNINGSKVVITTRIQEVPSYADPNCFVLEPQLLDNEKGWKLFSNIALGGQHSNLITNFESLGKEMVTKCGGLPLAIVTLAGLLRAQQTLDDWEHISKACGDNILEYGRVDKIIALSYLNLPSHLKPCFLYLAVFPEDIEISGSLVTQLWIAESLVTEDQQRGQEILEDVAKRCLDELVRRCMLQVVRRSHAGIVKKYRLHDLLRDFCIAKAKDQSFLEVFSPMNESTFDARVLALQARRATFHSRVSLPTQNLHLRSLIRFGKSGPYIVENIAMYEKVNMSMSPIYEKFTLLRVLNLWGIITARGKLSKEIGNLIHLRYLAIKATNINMFPKAIGNLKNLLTLDLRSNMGEGKIAFNLLNLIQIRHLHLGFNAKILTKNLGADKLKNLHSLKSIMGGNWMIKEMDGLSKGIRKLKIFQMSSKEQLQAVYRCPCITADSLQTLYLNWFDDENMKFEIEKLENCKCLRKITLDGRINGDNSIVRPLLFPRNIVRLELWRSYLKGKDWITTLGQLPYLKFLRLGPDSYEEALLIFADGAFPKLEGLMLHCLSNLEECRIEEGALTCLRSLAIIASPKLQRLPEVLRTITTLQQLTVYGMPSAFCKRLGWADDDGRDLLRIRNQSDKGSSSNATSDGRESKKRSGEDFHIIQHIPTIVIQYAYLHPLYLQRLFYMLLVQLLI